MKQLFIFMISALAISIGDLIDSGFCNSISIDAICALSAYGTIESIAYNIIQVGSYGYRVLLKDAKSCMAVQIVFSIVISIILLVVSNKVTFIFSISDVQRTMLIRVVQVCAIGLPLKGIRTFLFEYIKYCNRNTLLLTSNIVFYVCMIIADSIVVFYKLDVEYLIWGTNLCYLISIIQYLVASDFIYESKFRCRAILPCLKYGCVTLFDRLLGKVAITTMQVYASKLASIEYAIHSVCSSIVNNSCSITSATFDYQLVLIRDISDKDKLSVTKKSIRKSYPVVCTCTILVGISMSFIVHGKVELSQCFPYLFLYLSSALVLPLHENYRALLTSYGKAKALMIPGFVGMFVRVPVILISYATPIGLYGFSMAITIDFATRVMFERIYINKIQRSFVE